MFPKQLTRQTSWRHSTKVQVPMQTPQMVPLNREDQHFYSEPLQDDQTFHHLSKGEPRHPAEEAHFVLLNPQSCSFRHYPAFVNTDDGGYINQVVNRELHFLAQLSLHHEGQFLHHWILHQSVNLLFHFLLIQGPLCQKNTLLI